MPAPMRRLYFDNAATSFPKPPEVAAAVTRFNVDPLTGLIDLNEIRKAIKSNTKLVATIHGSNVTGTIQPIAEIGAICRERKVPFLVDTAQTIGHLPIDVQAMHIDLLA